MFQVQVIEGGSDVFNALCYSEKHPQTLRFMENQFNNITQTLTDAGKSFFSDVKNIYDQFNGSEAMRLARLAVNKVKGIFDVDNVKSIFELEEIQSAGFVMQRWIMAEPLTRQMYHDQLCDGFSETYKDMSPGEVGEQHYDYRRVMNGILVDDEKNDYKVTFYLDELYSDDRELTLDEQTDIMNTWECVRTYMEKGNIDPTSQYGGKL